jgi:hypothetical protein
MFMEEWYGFLGGTPKLYFVRKVGSSADLVKDELAWRGM